MAVYAVRHPEDVDNAKKILNGRRETEISSAGYGQLQRLVMLVSGQEYNIKMILTSPLKRASLMAFACQIHLGVPMFGMPILIERNCGVCTGVKYSELSKHATKYRNVGDHVYIEEAEGYENDEMLCERASEAHKRVLEITKDVQENEDVLIVSHGAFLRAMRLVIEGKTHHDFASAKTPKNCEIFRLF
ncbi:MAG TPA: phosphoglycerate mutase family protein [Candidatus Paceibacterota bacterium]